MGVPKEVCEDIINIDERGSTFIRYPLARKIWQRRIHNIATGTSYTDMNTSAAPPFEALRGVPQGDIPSPLCWDLFGDIVLCALDAIDWVTFWLETDMENSGKHSTSATLTICLS